MAIKVTIHRDPIPPPPPMRVTIELSDFEAHILEVISATISGPFNGSKFIDENGQLEIRRGSLDPGVSLAAVRDKVRDIGNAITEARRVMNRD